MCIMAYEDLIALNPNLTPADLRALGIAPRLAATVAVEDDGDGRSELEIEFAAQWQRLGEGVELKSEYRFAAHIVGRGPGIRQRLKDANLRDWRFDFCHMESKVAVELEGGTWTTEETKSRHTTGDGFEGDCYKYNAAHDHGWIVLRFTTSMISNDPAGCIELILRVIRRRLPSAGDGPWCGGSWTS